MILGTQTELDGIKLAFDILVEALDAGGYSAGRIVERIREEGVPVTVSDLHGHGLQAVANAISDAATEYRHDEMRHGLLDGPK